MKKGASFSFTTIKNCSFPSPHYMPHANKVTLPVAGAPGLGDGLWAGKQTLGERDSHATHAGAQTLGTASPDLHNSVSSLPPGLTRRSRERVCPGERCRAGQGAAQADALAARAAVATCGDACGRE